MSRESKIFKATIYDTQETISHYEAFGWELLSLNGSQITMSRETQNPVYPELVKHQAKYEELYNKYCAVRYPIEPQRPASFDFVLFLVLCALAIFPGAIYTYNKISQFRLYNEALQKYHAAVQRTNELKESILAEMEQVALDSRVIFFSRQS